MVTQALLFAKIKMFLHVVNKTLTGTTGAGTIPCEMGEPPGNDRFRGCQSDQSDWSMTRKDKKACRQGDRTNPQSISFGRCCYLVVEVFYGVYRNEELVTAVSTYSEA